MRFPFLLERNMTEKLSIKRFADRLKGALGLKKEMSSKEDLNVAAVANYEIKNHLISKGAIEADAQKYRELVISGQIDKYNAKFSAERNRSLQHDRLDGLLLHELFRSADRPMCLIFG